MQVVLHVGMHKTATSSVQRWLRVNWRPMADHGVRAFVVDRTLSPRTAKGFDPDGLRRKVETAQRDGIRRVIFSHEILSTLNRAQSDLLREVFAAFSVRYVVGVRHWTRFLPSRWAQSALRRDCHSFPDFLEQMTRAPERFDMQFDRVFHNLGMGEAARNGDETVVVPFETARSQDWVVRTTLRACGVPEGAMAGDDPDQGQANKTKSYPEPDLVRLFNGLHAKRESLPPNEMFDAFGAYRGFSSRFNFARPVGEVMKQRPRLHDDLVGLLNAHKTIVTLRQAEFAEYEARLKQAAFAYLGGRVGAGMFPALPDNRFTCSRADPQAIPSSLQRDMMQGLDRVLAQTAARKPG